MQVPFKDYKLESIAVVPLFWHPDPPEEPPGRQELFLGQGAKTGRGFDVSRL